MIDDDYYGTVDLPLLDKQIRTFSKLIPFEKPNPHLEGLYELLCTIWEQLKDDGEIMLKAV